MSTKHKRIPYIFVEWTGNDSKLYDGLAHWVPKQKLTVTNANIGDIVTIKWYGKLWRGYLQKEANLTKMELKSVSKTTNNERRRVKENMELKSVSKTTNNERRRVKEKTELKSVSKTTNNERRHVKEKTEKRSSVSTTQVGKVCFTYWTPN